MKKMLPIRVATHPITVVALSCLLASCVANPERDSAIAFYRAHGGGCEIGASFNKLTYDEQWEYIVGSQVVRPADACVPELLSKQDVKYLEKLRETVWMKNNVNAVFAFVGAISRKSARDEMSDEMVKSFRLEELCKRVFSFPDDCLHDVRHIPAELSEPNGAAQGEQGA